MWTPDLARLGGQVDFCSPSLVVLALTDVNVLHIGLIQPMIPRK